MLNLDGYLALDRIDMVNRYTVLRFDETVAFKTPEALALHELRLMSDGDIKGLCEEVYGFELYEPRTSYVPDKLVQIYRDSNAVPVVYRPMKNQLVAVYVPELGFHEMEYKGIETVYKPTTVYYYMKQYQQCYGPHRVLKDIPARMLYDNVMTEAIELGASDITISNNEFSTEVYYNVRKVRVDSSFVFSRHVMSEILKIITIKSPLDWGSRDPKLLDIDINEDFRGRVVINRKFLGYTVTIRLVANRAFKTDISDLGMTRETEEWLSRNILDNEYGLRVIVGGTMHGKNTTALALLKRLVESGRYKVVSVEAPVEQKLKGVEQINCETVEEYVSNINSLIRVNPDFIYVTEMSEMTGREAVQVANTGKCVLSTLHANSVTAAIVRLIDITGLETDRLVQSLHSIVYQELVRDEEQDVLYPRNSYVRFTQQVKYRLYGKSLGDILRIVSDYEEGDIWTSTQHMA